MTTALGVTERAILLDVVRSAVGTHTSALTDHLRRPVDWPALIDAAEYHGLICLLARELRSHEDQTPAEALEPITNRYRSVGRRNLYLTVQLNAIIASLTERGVRSLPFKGPVLGARYRSAADRPFADVDLLIPPDRRADAISILQASGFRTWKERVEDDAYAIPFLRDEGQVCIDLHWGFAKRWFGAALDFERIWQDGAKVQLTNAQTRTFSLEDQLLHLCIHGAKHGPTPWPKLKWVADVAVLLAAPAPEGDWARAVEHAEAAGCRAMLSLGVALARQLLGIPVPGALGEAVARDSPVLGLIASVEKGIWAQGRTPISADDRLGFDLTIRERRRDRWAYLLRRGSTTRAGVKPGTGDAQRHGGRIAPLRLARLAFRYGLDPGRLRRLISR